MTIGFELSDGVALVTLDRPEKLNALDTAAHAELSAVWQRVRDDPAVRVAVLTGVGERSFCVGADLHDPGTVGGGLGEAMLTQRGQLLDEVRRRGDRGERPARRAGHQGARGPVAVP
ncbi:enoyl-CoA hydratase/isomerase family protein [Pseudonocardia sp. RS010]|uniref:enoyl-CoA hydratase/isomerase family protein n=1 Tax=Pseudonocardia sp. RS010 TaxID=3385979 RepID=UPI0039A21299